MNITEHDLPHLLRERAGEAPGADGLLAAVHARSRRARRRTATGALATAAALVVTAGAIAVTATSTGRGEVVLAWQNTSQSGFLVPTDLRPSFPLSPAYLPPGLDADPRLSAERGTATATWERLQGGQDGPLSALSVSVSASKPDEDARTAAELVDVDGRTAALRRYEASTGITWQRTPQQWVHVSSFAPVTEQETLAFARALRDQEQREGASFVLDVAPQDYVLAAYQETGLTIGPAAGIPNPQDDPRSVQIAVRQASEATDGTGTPVRVGQQGGWLDETNGRYYLILRLSDDLRLDVSTPATGRWDREELARFVTGITYSGATPRQEG